MLFVLGDLSEIDRALLSEKCQILPCTPELNQKRQKVKTAFKNKIALNKFLKISKKSSRLITADRKSFYVRAADSTTGPFGTGGWRRGWGKRQIPRSRLVPGLHQHVHTTHCHAKLLHDSWWNIINSQTASSPPPNSLSYRGSTKEELCLKCTKEQSVGHHTSARITAPEALCKLTVSYTKRKAFQYLI